MMRIEEVISLLRYFDNSISKGLNARIGNKVLIRTHTAGVWYGVLSEKSGREVLLTSARKIYRWQQKEGIPLTTVSLHGINHNRSSISETLAWVWLESIEIIPCTDKSIESIEGAANSISG